MHEMTLYLVYGRNIFEFLNLHIYSEYASHFHRYLHRQHDLSTDKIACYRIESIITILYGRNDGNNSLI